MKYNEIPLDLSKPLIIRREFTVNGHPQYVGKAFDWRRIAVSERKVRQLYETRKIVHGDSVTYPEVKTEEVTDPVIYPPKEEDADGLSDLTMPELRKIADEVGADYKVSKKDQREAIRAKRGE